MTIVLSPSTYFGSKFYFYAQDREMGERIALGKFEPYLTKLFLRELRAGARVIDIGANLGYYSVLAGKMGCEVLAFEPEENNFKLLLENIKINKLQRKIRPFCVALGNKVGKIDLNVSLENFGDHSVFERRNRSVSVLMDKLDNLVINKIDFIKSDTQGAEAMIFAGANKTLCKYKPTIMYEHWFSNPPDLSRYFLYEIEEYWQVRQKMMQKRQESVNVWATKNPLTFYQRFGDFWFKKYLKSKFGKSKT